MSKLGSIILGVIVHGVVLGVVLSIAWPVKCLCDKSAIRCWNSMRGLLRKPVKVEVSKEQI